VTTERHQTLVRKSIRLKVNYVGSYNKHAVVNHSTVLPPGFEKRFLKQISDTYSWCVNLKRLICCLLRNLIMVIIKCLSMRETILDCRRICWISFTKIIMKHIIKLFLVTFSFYYIGNISRLTSGVKVTNEATR
jgi:hypothetical protein